MGQARADANPTGKPPRSNGQSPRRPRLITSEACIPVVSHGPYEFTVCPANSRRDYVMQTDPPDALGETCLGLPYRISSSRPLLHAEAAMAEAVEGRTDRGASRRASMTGLMVLLAATTMAFAAFTSAFWVRLRHVERLGHVPAAARVLYLTTATVLIASSVMLELARKALKSGTYRS